MPHMMPMMWMLIFITSLLTFLIIMMMLYFLMLHTFMSPLNFSSSKNKLNLWTWKW